MSSARSPRVIAGSWACAPRPVETVSTAAATIRIALMVILSISALFECDRRRERLRDNQHTVRDPDRQRRQRPRRRTVDDPGAVSRIELREVTLAREQPRCRLPVVDVAAGVRA